MKLLSTTVLLGALCATVLTGCGDDKKASATPQSKSLQAFSPSFGQESSFQKIRKARTKAVKKYLAAKELSLHAKFMAPNNDLCDLFTINAGMDGCTDSCDFDGSDTSAMKLKMTTACSGDSTTGECGGVTYTLDDYDMAFDVDLTFNQSGDGTGKVSMEMSGDLSSSDDSVKGAVACDFSFAADLKDEGSVNCSNADFSCKVGGQTVTCEELEASENSCE